MIEMYVSITLTGAQRDTHCSDCKVDTTETVIYDGSDVVTEQACCGLQVEYLRTEFLDLLGE